MTIQTDFRQRFDVSSDTYWNQLCLSLEYQERLYTEALGCTRMEVVQLDGSIESGQKRRLRFQKKVDAPLAVRKLVGDTVSLEEVSEWNAAERRWSYRMVPAVIGDRVEIRGTLHLDESQDGVEQISTCTVSCKIFGIGSVLEHFVAKSSHEANVNKAAFTRKYIADLGLR